MGKYTVNEDVVVHRKQVPRTFTTEQLRATFGPDTLVWVLLDHIDELDTRIETLEMELLEEFEEKAGEDI